MADLDDVEPCRPGWAKPADNAPAPVALEHIGDKKQLESLVKELLQADARLSAAVRRRAREADDKQEGLSRIQRTGFCRCE